MSVKSRTILPTIVVVGLLIGGFQLLGPKKAGTGKDDRTVGVYGVWEPSPYRDGVAVVVSIAGKAKVDTTATTAPFTRTFAAKVGDEVIITLTFKSGLGTKNFQGVLGCSITSNGLEETHDYNQRATLGNPLRCAVVLT
jgi:hypothetical protein